MENDITQLGLFTHLSCSLLHGDNIGSAIEFTASDRREKFKIRYLYLTHETPIQIKCKNNNFNDQSYSLYFLIIFSNDGLKCLSLSILLLHSGLNFPRVYCYSFSVLPNQLYPYFELMETHSGVQDWRRVIWLATTCISCVGILPNIYTLCVLVLKSARPMTCILFKFSEHVYMFFLWRYLLGLTRIYIYTENDKYELYYVLREIRNLKNMQNTRRNFASYNSQTTKIGYSWVATFKSMIDWK